MQIDFLFRGVVIGFAIAAPVGPIGVLCARRALTGGRAAGFVSGLGAATADAVYGCIAGFGLVAVSNILINLQVWLRLIGGAYLCYLGINTFFNNSSPESTRTLGTSLVRAYASTLLLTLSNPITILSFAAVFAGLGLASSVRDDAAAARLVAGIFAGSTIWWFVLSCCAAALRNRLYDGAWRWINRLTGVIFAVFGVLAFVSVL